jgi:XTP/dITP diphosphohydrolase
MVCASANPHKVAEIAALFAGVDGLRDTVELVARPAHVPDVVEDADTLIGNARLKAEAIAAATGEPAISDDTGLFVDALDGRPGVHTARYAGPAATAEQNRSLLLRELDGIDDEHRTARFVTVVMVVWPATSSTPARELAVEGVCEGRIAKQERGARGFGYDPLFVPAGVGPAGEPVGDGRTFAEMTDDEKHAISHRGRAFAALARALADDVPHDIPDDVPDDVPHDVH